MADQFKEVTKRGYGSRIIGSIKGIGFGLLLFFGSFVVLFNNEGSQNVAEIADTAIEIDANQAVEDLDGKLVAASGTVVSEEMLGDGLYLVAGDYLSVDRKVEMYAWVEKTSSTSKTNLGGSETTETTYNYVKEWTSSPASTGSFKYPEDHENSSLPIEGGSFSVSSAKVGMYNLDVSKLQLPASSPLTLNQENTLLSGDAVLSGNYIYIPATKPVSEFDYYYEFEEDTTSSSVAAPELGDVRISYTALKDSVEGTVFGKLDGDSIVKFVDAEKDNASVYRLFKGDKQEAVAQYDKEHTFSMWMWRIIGFFMMWMGLSALVAPISVLLDVVPFLGSLSRAATGTVTFLAALILSLVTIVVSMIVHSLLALVIVALGGVGIFMFFLKKKGEKTAPIKTV